MVKFKPNLAQNIIGYLHVLHVLHVFPLGKAQQQKKKCIYKFENLLQNHFAIFYQTWHKTSLG